MSTATDVKPTRWGILSTGYISNKFCTALKTLFPDEHQLVAVAARSLEPAQEFARKYSIDRAYGSYEELGRDPEVEVVYVGVVTSRHFEVSKQLLELGKHLLIEKPMTMNANETRQLVQLARSKGLFLMEAIWSRFLPAYRFAVEELRRGAIGEILNAQATMCVAFPAGHNISNAQVGGGAIYAIGVYPINGVTYLAYPGEKPIKVSSVGALKKEDGADLSVSAVMLYSRGRTATLNMDLRVESENDLHLSGTSGRMTLHSPFWATERVTINGVSHKFPILPEEKIRREESGEPEKYDSYHGLAYQAQEVRRCLAAKLVESQNCSHEDSILIGEIEDEMRAQVTTNNL